MKKRIGKHLNRLRQKSPVKRLRPKDSDVTDAAKVPFITNETIAEHREEVLAGARKYIYPLQHSKHRIVLISSALFIVTVIVFFSYTLLALYKFQSTSTFTYRITQVVPFPIAKTKGGFVSYESYLFELRHYMHYYETQQKLSFKTETGQQQLEDFKKRALERVVNDAYVKQLAKQNNVAVTNQEVDKQISVVRSQNRLGTSDQVFEDVLRDFWGWSLNDFKRSLRQQLVAQKVVATLDTAAKAKADAAEAELTAGTPFADVVKKYSEDATSKDTGGEYGIPIDKTNRDLSAAVTDALFTIKAGEWKRVDTGYTIELVKALSFENDKVKAAHIQIIYKNLNEFLDPLKEKQKARLFVQV